MGATKKDEKVVTTEVQSQQGGQDSQNASKKDLYANDPIAQRIAKGKELRDKIGETISTPIQKEEPFDYDQAYKDAKNEVDMTRSLHDTEREGEENRQKNRRIMTAIGDGLSGLANIYFTSQGTPDLLKGAPSLTGKMQERYDKMRKDAETRRANYLKVVQEGANQKVKDMYTRYKDDLEAKRKEEELELKEASEARQRAKLEFDQAIAKAKEERDKELHSLDVKAKDYEVKKAEIEARYIEKEKQANLRLKAAQTASANRANRDNKSNEKEDYILVSQDDGQGNRLSRKVYKNDPDYIQYKNQFAQDGWSALD